jgi:hypothetical protein
MEKQSTRVGKKEDGKRQASPWIERMEHGFEFFISPSVFLPVSVFFFAAGLGQSVAKTWRNGNGP